MDTPEYDEIVRTLVQIAAHQATINDRVAAAIDRIDATLARQESTHARIEVLLGRMLHAEPNGRDA